MARINIDAHALDEIEKELAAKGVIVTAIDAPWDYLLEAPRAVLEEVLLEHWGYSQPGLADEWPETKARIEEATPTPEALAAAFSCILRGWWTAEQLADVVAQNRAETDPMICHSHDYCDANEAMLQAMESFGMQLDTASEEQTALINAAWDMAKKSGFGHAQA